MNPDRRGLKGTYSHDAEVLLQSQLQYTDAVGQFNDRLSNPNALFDNGLLAAAMAFHFWEVSPVQVIHLHSVCEY
jgi:hypothetical protein